MEATSFACLALFCFQRRSFLRTTPHQLTQAFLRVHTCIFATMSWLMAPTSDFANGLAVFGLEDYYVVDDDDDAAPWSARCTLIGFTAIKWWLMGSINKRSKIKIVLMTFVGWWSAGAAWRWVWWFTKPESLFSAYTCTSQSSTPTLQSSLSFSLPFEVLFRDHPKYSKEWAIAPRRILSRRAMGGWVAGSRSPFDFDLTRRWIILCLALPIFFLLVKWVYHLCVERFAAHRNSSRISLSITFAWEVLLGDSTTLSLTFFTTVCVCNWTTVPDFCICSVLDVDDFLVVLLGDRVETINAIIECLVELEAPLVLACRAHNADRVVARR